MLAQVVYKTHKKASPAEILGEEQLKLAGNLVRPTCVPTGIPENQSFFLKKLQFQSTKEERDLTSRKTESIHEIAAAWLFHTSPCKAQPRDAHRGPAEPGGKSLARTGSSTSSIMQEASPAALSSSSHRSFLLQVPGR